MLRKGMRHNKVFNTDKWERIRAFHVIMHDRACHVEQPAGIDIGESPHP